jgi:hypothetical protein
MFEAFVERRKVTPDATVSPVETSGGTMAG